MNVDDEVWDIWENYVLEWENSILQILCCVL